jgi:hypothetical protein
MRAFTGATQNAAINEKFMPSGKAVMMGLALAVCPETRGHCHDHFSATVQRIHRI